MLNSTYVGSLTLSKAPVPQRELCCALNLWATPLKSAWFCVGAGIFLRNSCGWIRAKVWITEDIFNVTNTRGYCPVLNRQALGELANDSVLN